MRNCLRTLLLLFFLSVVVHAGRAATLTVGAGQQYSSIQAAINDAHGGDTVLIAPGTYYERINFLGKVITVTSSGGAANTIIDAQNRGAAVSFQSQENRNSVLSNLTIQNGGSYGNPLLNNGLYLDVHPGAIFLYQSSPTILNNVIRNSLCYAILASQSGSLIQGNHITSTNTSLCGSGIGEARRSK